MEDGKLWADLALLSPAPDCCPCHRQIAKIAESLNCRPHRRQNPPTISRPPTDHSCVGRNLTITGGNAAYLRGKRRRSAILPSSTRQIERLICRPHALISRAHASTRVIHRSICGAHACARHADALKREIYF